MAVNLSPVGGVAAQFFDNSGQVLTGGKLYSYLAGTTTPAITYTTSNGITAHSNPIVLDAAGRVPNSGEIWLTDGISYKFILKDSNDVQIATWDNIIGINSNFVNYSLQTDVQTATQGQTVFNLSGVTYQPATNSLAVFVNGSRQIITINYIETDATTVTFVDGLNVGDVVEFITATSATGNATTAQNVSYNEGSAGAVTRSVESKLQETVSVKDFGAVGDGVTDDTLAIQTAIDSMERGILLFPAGDYRTTDTIVIADKNDQNDDTQSNFEISAYGAKIVSEVTGSTEALYISACKRLIIRGLEVVAASTTLNVQVQGMWHSTWDSCNFGTVTFSGLGATFDSHYLNKFQECYFETITLDTGTNADRSEFNGNIFDSCRIWFGEYGIKKYGEHGIEGATFINCDISYQSIAILYVDEETFGSINFISCYFDSATGFPYDTKGIMLDFTGATMNPNSANTEAFVAKTASGSQSKGYVGVRVGNRIPTSSYNLIKNGNISLGTNSVTTANATTTVVSGPGLFGKYLNSTTTTTFGLIQFNSLPVPVDGFYTLTVIGRASNIGNVSTECNGVFGVIDLSTDWTISSFTTYITQGSSVGFRTTNGSGATMNVDFAYVGLTYGSSAPLYAPTIPLIGSATYNPASLTTGTGVTTTVTCTGATVGMFATASFGVDLQGITVTAWVSAADTVSVRFQNQTGGTIDLASSTLTVKAEY